MSVPLKDHTYIVGRERRQRSAPTTRDRRSQNSARSQRYLPIPHRSVSRRHAEIFVLNGTIYLRDLGSKNGTFIVEKDKKVPFTEGYVEPEQRVMFGDCARCIGELLREHQASGAQAGQAEAQAQQKRQ